MALQVDMAAIQMIQNAAANLRGQQQGNIQADQARTGIQAQNIMKQQQQQFTGQQATQAQGAAQALQTERLGQQASQFESSQAQEVSESVLNRESRERIGVARTDISIANENTTAAAQEMGGDVAAVGGYNEDGTPNPQVFNSAGKQHDFMQRRINAIEGKEGWDPENVAKTARSFLVEIRNGAVNFKGAVQLIPKKDKDGKWESKASYLKRIKGAKKKLIDDMVEPRFKEEMGDRQNLPNWYKNETRRVIRDKILGELGIESEQ